MTQYDETKLLCDALLFEHGHARRTQHILKVYALAKLIGEAQRLPAWEQRIVQAAAMIGELSAAAILHDIAIGPCKQKYGEATQDKQRREAPALVRRFLRAAGYPEKDQPRILYLVQSHHAYDRIDGMDFQVLVEADLIVGAYESTSPCETAAAARGFFRTATGKALLEQIIDRTT